MVLAQIDSKNNKIFRLNLFFDLIIGILASNTITCAYFVM